MSESLLDDSTRTKSPRLFFLFGVLVNACYVVWLLNIFFAIEPGTEIRPMGVEGAVGIFSLLMLAFGFMPALALLKQTGKRVQGALLLALYMSPLPLFVVLMKAMSQIRGFSISE